VARSITVDFLGNDKSLGRTINDVDSKTSRLGSTMRKVSLVAAGLLAGAVVIGAKALWDMGKAAAADQVEAEKLKLALQNNANATDAQVASTEKWITAQGVALGVTDDELRPALARLVTATHDVGKAQKLASLAMDVSAGTGKSLESVSTALMKAQNGQVSALARLGINTKNAAGETITMEQAVRRMSDTFGGQATTKANTFQGQMTRLKVIFDETKEAIGYRLLPIATKLATWFLNEGMPAMARFSGWMQANLLPIFSKLGDLWHKVMAALSGDTSGAVSDVRGILGSLKDIFKSTVSIAQSIWKRFGAILTEFTKGSFKNILQVIKGAFQVIRGIFKVVSSLLKGDWKGVWSGLKDIVKGAWKIIGGIVKQGLNLIRTAMRSAWSAIRALTSAAWNGIKQIPGKAMQAIRSAVSAGMNVVRGVMRAGWSAVRELVGNAWNAIKEAVAGGIIKVVGLARGLPGRIKSALGNLAGLLVASGAALIGGLISGIGSKIHDLVSKMGEVANVIKDHMPFSPVKRGPLKAWNDGSPGIKLIGMLIKGIRKGEKPLDKVMEKVTGVVKARGDKLKGLLSSMGEFVSGFKQSFSTSIFGADFTDPESGADTTTVGKILSFAAQQRANAAKLRNNIAKLIKLGMSKDLLQQLSDAGPSGVAKIDELATHASRGQLAQLNSYNASTQGLNTAAGKLIGNQLYGTQIADARDQLAVAQRAEQLLQKIEAHLGKKDTAEVRIKGGDLVVTIRKEERRTGRKLLASGS
jgi:phage-related protein